MEHNILFTVVTPAPAESHAVLLYGVQDIVVGIPSGWTVWRSNPGGGARSSVPVHTGSEAHTTYTGSLPGIKRPGASC